MLSYRREVVNKSGTNKMSELIFLKKKNTVKPSKINNIDLIIGNRDRETKNLIKNTKAKNKFQKYFHKQEKNTKISYPTIGELKTTKRVLGKHQTHDRREMLSHNHAISYQNPSSNRVKSGKRKSSKSNTSRRGVKVHPKKSLTRLDRMVIDNPFIKGKHKKNFSSFQSGAMKFKKHTPKVGQQNNKLYTIKTVDNDIPQIVIERSTERKHFDSISTQNNNIYSYCSTGKNKVLNLSNKRKVPNEYQSYCKIPQSTKSMNMNLFSNNTQIKTSYKNTQKGHKKTYKRKSEVGFKKFK